MDQELTVVFPLYPQVTQLDFTGPLEVFSRLPRARTLLASVAGGSLDTGIGMQLSGLVPLANIGACDVLCVPGGWGTVEMLTNAPYLGELWRLGQRARYLSSVCTGSLLLAAAGLLRGKRAACHWAWRELLAEFDVEVATERVVRDGNLFTGSGVTAGIDLALTVASEIAGPDYAASIELKIEYAPAPPFGAGRPELAEPALLESVKQLLERSSAGRRAAVLEAVAVLRSQEGRLAQS